MVSTAAIRKNIVHCVAPHVIQIQVTYFSYRLVNAYLITGDPPALIDSGHLQLSCFNILETVLAELGYCLNDIECIIYTHPHIDHLGGGVLISRQNPNIRHIGFAEAVDAFECQARFNRELIQAAHHFLDSRGYGAPFSFLARAKQVCSDGLSCDEDTSIPLQERLHDGDEVTAGGLRLSIVHTPSHTPWDISLYEPSRGLLFTGDFLLEKVASLLSTITQSDFDGYVTSLKKVRGLKLTTILPGHGRAVHQPYQLIDTWKAELARREKFITAMLRQGKVTVHDINSSLLRDKNDDVDTWYHSLGFVDTYLAKLAREGKAIRMWEETGVAYTWRG